MRKISESRCCFSLQEGSEAKAPLHHCEARRINAGHEAPTRCSSCDQVQTKSLPSCSSQEHPTENAAARASSRDYLPGADHEVGTVTFLIQPATPSNSAATYVSQHVHLHLRTRFKITPLNNVNDSLPPDLFLA